MCGAIVVVVPAQAASAAAKGGLQVCDVAANPTLVGKRFSFTENGGPVIHVKAGSPGAPGCGHVRQYRVGAVVDVAELPTQNLHVSGIAVSDGRGTNANTAAGTVTATVGAGITIVTFSNDVNTGGDRTGLVEICVSGDASVQASFAFTISQGGTTLAQPTVSAGQCTAPIKVPVGNATVAETAQSPYFVSEIDVTPQNRSVNTNLAEQTATVAVVKGDASTITAMTFVQSTSSS